MTTASTVWDTQIDPCPGSGLIYRWNGYREGESVHSLLRYVETHGERLRLRYLAWIDELGESQIAGERLIDRLALDDGLSYWWLTRFVERNPWESQAIIDVIRLFALEEILIQRRPARLRLVSANRRLHRVLRDLCQSTGIEYEWERRSEKSVRHFSVRDSYRALPQPVQAVASLTRRLLIRWRLRRGDMSGWSGGGRALFYCSWFFNVVPSRATEGEFYSRCWERLPELAGRLGLSGNWLHLYYPHNAVPDPSIAAGWVQDFNRRREREGFHAFLESYLSWRLVLRVLMRWLKLALISWRLRGIEQAFRPSGSRLSLWPLMRDDWEISTRGSLAIINLLLLELFDAALREIPTQQNGLYLYENQPWERMLIHAWRKHGHGRLIAVQHATVRFWDLRYSSSSYPVQSAAAHSMPRPNLVALNSRATVDAFLRAGYPRESIVECEALRYGYLGNLPARRPGRMADDEPTRVLILGDYSPSATTHMLLLLEAAVPHVSVPATYTIKPHPNCMVRVEDYPRLIMNVVLNPLEDLLPDFDIAYASNATSAAVDAHLAGLPVVIVLEETQLNFSPMRGHRGARFVSTSEELAEALQATDQALVVKADRDEFFFLDQEMPRWRRLLESHS